LLAQGIYWWLNVIFNYNKSQQNEHMRRLCCCVVYMNIAFDQNKQKLTSENQSIHTVKVP